MVATHHTQGGTPPAIELQDVSLTFGSKGSGAPAVLDHVDLSIARGEFVALVGASGCGKTTVLNLVAGLLGPNDGRVLIHGKEVTAPTADIGYMFARDAMLPWRTAVRNVMLSLESRPGWSDRSKRRERAVTMLEQMGLRGVENRYRSQLSQGMRQRVALARTFAPSPGILLMDEPFAALDALTKLAIQEEFLRIWEHEHKYDRQTVVFVTHDLHEAVLLADRVVVMGAHPGRIHYTQEIDLPRPRNQELEDVIFTDEFRAMHANLFNQLQAARLADPLDVIAQKGRAS